MNNLRFRSFAVAILVVFVFFACLATFTIPVAAQSTFGSISGTVSDATGASMAGASVTLTNLGTGSTQTLSTNPDGLYSFVNLNPGAYSLNVEKTGFKHFRRDPINVQVQQAVSIDIAMEVGAVSQVVEVTSETPLLQPTTSSLGQVIEERKANEIPLNGRNVFNLITLSPAAIAQGGSGGSPVG
ncbi:MAG: carboxypeptidase-like regulatory domain-containing protein, partial [Candidatus Acidiferrales bacterium]